jgi:DNA mismatch repair protein MutL
MIDVKNLFYNTPARRKFLKSAQTEMGHILETISAIALGCPGIAFQLTHNGKKVKNWPLSGDPLDRASAVLGQNVRPDLHKIQMETTAVALHGWISSPHLTRSTSQKIYLYVNGRYIRDRGLQHALFEGYRGRLMKGRFPIAVIFITVPHEQLDVNVHPTKHEVRFTGYRTVYETLKKAVFNAWNAMDHKKTFPASPARPTVPGDTAKPITPVIRTPHQAREIPFRKPLAAPLEAISFHPKTSTDAISETQAAYAPPEPTATARTIQEPLAGPEEYAAPTPIDEEELRIIGQLHNTFIVCESDQGLVLFDQHAAHERILFEHLKKKSGTAGARSQKLLMPEMIDLGYKESNTLEKLIPGLLQFGLEIEPFGGTTFAVKAIPSLLADREVKPLIIEIIEKTNDIGFAEGIDRSLDECLILMACHGSIRANQSLSEKEMQGLIHQLTQCENTSHCPHGRPIRINWPVADIEKKFKRIL